MHIQKVFCWHLDGHWRKEQDPYQHPEPDPLFRGMDPRIRIRILTKMSWIRHTAFSLNFPHFPFAFSSLFFIILPLSLLITSTVSVLCSPFSSFTLLPSNSLLPYLSYLPCCPILLSPYYSLFALQSLALPFLSHLPSSLTP